MSVPTPLPVTPATSTPLVMVGGQEADTTSVTVYSDSPAYLGIPPRQGAVAGAEADIEWEYPADAQTEVETPWSGAFRPIPGQQVTIDMPDPDGNLFTAATLELESSSVSLDGTPIRSRCTDPLADVDTTFTVHAITSVMPIPHDTSGTPADRLHVGSLGVWQVERALAEIGAGYTLPVRAETVAHHTMCGSLWPARGVPLVGQRAVNGGIGADTPPVPVGSYGPDFESTDDGRVMCLSGYVDTLLTTWTGPTARPWTIITDLFPGESANYQVRVRGTAGLAGLQLRVTTGNIEVRTIGGDGNTQEVLGTFTRSAAATRALLRANPGTGTVTFLTDAPGDTPTTWAGKAPAALNTATGRLIVSGHNFGPTTVNRDRPAADQDDDLHRPRTAQIHLAPIQDEQWRIHGHPAIVGEVATTWLAHRAQQEQSLLWTDPEGVTHWMEVRGLDDLPNSGTISDAQVDGSTLHLEGLAHTTARRDQFRRVRVTGTRSGASYSYSDRPHLVACAATEKVELQVGDDPVEMWLTPDNGGWWYGRVQTSYRWAGEAATEPWHKPDDFARTRGTWVGGHVISINGEVSRWAEPGDAIFTIERVGQDSVKVTIAPGPNLLPGQTFVNMPFPHSAGLEDAPDIRNQALPIVCAWAVVPEPLPIEGTSTQIGPSNRPEYHHDAGFSAGFRSGPRTPAALAQDIADRHTSHVGEVTVTCPVADVRIGQRWRIEVSTVSGFVMDAVILGVPRITASARGSYMELRTWVMSVHPITDIDYPPAYAGLAYAGLSYAGL